jgi:uncharacterized protein YbaR (Trm112 family)
LSPDVRTGASIGAALVQRTSGWPESRFSPLRYDREAQELISEEAGLAYPIRDGIPIMVDERLSMIDPSP